MNLSKELRNIVPKDCIFVSESGIQTPEDVVLLKQIGADAVLVGEALMRAEDKTKMLHTLKGE